MEIKDLILLMWRKARYIVLGLVLGAGIGVFVAKVQPPVYEATTKILVSRVGEQSNSDMFLLDEEQLYAVNLQLIKSQPVLNEVSSQLGSKINKDDIRVEEIANTTIIQVKVQDNDPQRAAAIANLLVQTLVQQNHTLLSERYTASENAITEQLDQVQKQIDSLQTQIGQISDTGIQEQLTQVGLQIEQLQTQVSGLEQEIAGFPFSPSPRQRISLAEKQAQLDQLNSLMAIYQQIQTNLTYIGKPGENDSNLEDPRLTTLQSTLELYRQINIALINSLENIHLVRAQGGQNVMQIVSATPSKDPILPMPNLYFLLGGVAGLVLAVISILILDHMNDSLKSAGQIEDLLGLPVLGFVFGNKRIKGELVTSHDPFSAGAEALRALGVSVEIIGAEKNTRSLMIMNAEPADARTSIAANLAVLNAQQGKQVILLDGDLKHPHLHSLFEMENQKGFAELLNDGLEIMGACHVVKGVKGMTLIPSGVTEKDSTKWLDAKKWEQLLFELQKKADLVIVDSPSADTADAQILASKMNAVLLVVESGHTHIASVQNTLRRFQLIGSGVTGVVLNRAVQNWKINTQFLTWLKTRSALKEKPSEVDGEIEKSAISLS